MKTTTISNSDSGQKHAMAGILSSQEGSVIVLALLILVALTLGGITSTQRSSTEAFIVRNTAIYKQNLQLAETAAMEAIGELLRMEDLAEDWIHNKEVWDDNPDNADGSDDDSYPLTDANSRIPVSVEEGMLAVLEQRGEVQRDAGGNVTDSSLRHYVVGWEHPSQLDGFARSIVSKPGTQWVQGRAIGRYASNRFGIKTVEVGVLLLRLEE